MRKISILALSGSLRSVSYNSSTLRALSALAPPDVKFQTFFRLGELPLFNPDREGEDIEALHALKSALASCDGLWLASPEYAHGISGVMKNTLDWLVSGLEFIDKPVAFINTSPRAHHAQDALREVVKTMSGQIIEPACFEIPLLGTQLNCEGILAHHTYRSQLEQQLTIYVEHLRQLLLD